jgi:hypothetical protein
VLFDMLQQAFGILAQPEEVAFFLDQLYRSLAVWAVTFFQSALHPECLAGSTVPALIGALVNISLIVDFLKYRLYRPVMSVISGAHKIVIPDVHLLPEVLKRRHNLINVGLWRNTLGQCGPLDLLAVFIGPGDKIDVPAGKAMPAGQ